MREQIEVSLNTLLTAMRQAGGGEPHQIFAGGLRYIPPSSVKQVNREAFEELSQYGLTQGDGFTPEFEEILHLLDRPATEYFAYARDMKEQLGVLVAGRGRFAVTALCQGDRVWLKTVSPDNSPADALIANLPPYAPAHFTPFSVPQEEFRRGEEEHDIYDSSPARSRDARQLDEIFGQPHYGVGQFYAAKRSPDGSRTMTRDSMSYLDVDSGRVAMTLTGSPGNRHITVLPGAPGLMAQKVAALRAGLDH
ncbi:ESX secretion-associated protein EspG [Amycolatopsis tolypomycina]|uniref:ESX secretion-associated protein EspG n=1 Tax=Amycolatopsis tolypomycina TaxID=208445 RepID=UPI001FCA3094|nr:ESX secretion-associated protein EspG [Amycolatopsis tolypomycina]